MQTQDPINLEILRVRMDAFNAVTGPRVGDFLELPRPDPRCPTHTRLTHDWGDTLQTGGCGGSYYLQGRCLSYSGGLDPGLSVVDLVPTPELKTGSVWFFDRDISGAGRGVYFNVPMRVFKPRPGANLDGVEEVKCPFWVSFLDEERHKHTCGYWFTITKNAMAHTAFRLRSELDEWLKREKLHLQRDLVTPGSARLDWGCACQ